MKITLTKDEVEDILNDDYIEGKFKKHHRHNGGHQEVIFLRDNRHYLFTYLWFEDDGIEWDDNYEAQEVVEAEKVVKYWKYI